MSKIIKDRQVVADNWTVFRLSEEQTAATVTVPSGHVIVPLSVWQAQHSTLSSRKDIGVWIASAERAETIAKDVQILPLIAIDFPKFFDGRGYSIAYTLRGKLNFTGELRAIGDVLRDQLFYMQRVGFNAFAPRADRDIHEALKGLTDFSDSYQSSIDQKIPLFRRVERPTGAGA